MLKSFLSFLSLSLLIVVTGCSSSTAPDPNAGVKAPFTAFYAQPDQTLPVNIRIAGDIAISGLQYGTAVRGQGQIGSSTSAKIEAQSGTELASTNLKIDTNTATWIIYGGTGLQSEAISISTPKLTKTALGILSGVRFVNAAPNSGKLELHVEAPAGTRIGEKALEYKNSSSVFAAIASTTSKLVLTKEDGTSLLELSVKDMLTSGSLYTVVAYGNINSTGVSPMTVKLVAEP